MKTILLSAALTAALFTSLHAQTAPNRGGVGEVPADKNVPATPDKSTDADERTASGKSADEMFIHKAGKAGKMEAKMAQQGVDKASREDLKAFCAMLLKDHSAANMELAAIAKSMGVEVPEPMMSKDPAKSEGDTSDNDPSGRKIAGASPGDPRKDEADSKHHGLSDKTGVAFDAALMELMEECHTKDIALFEKAGNEVKSPELKGFITKTLPVLKSHATALAGLERKDPSRPDAKTGNKNQSRGARNDRGPFDRGSLKTAARP